MAKRATAPTLLKIPLDRSAAPESGKYSELFLEFAQPLLELDPSGPPQDLQTMRSVLEVAMLCWNAPVMERFSSDAATLHTPRDVERAFQHAPAEVQQAIRERMHARITQFGAVPVYLLVRLEGTNLENARLVAEARLPGPKLGTE